jgi:voltage-gated potassium channel
LSALKERLDDLYNGRNSTAVRFRYGLLTVDLITISFFIALALVEDQPGWILPVDYAIALILSADFAARLYIDKRRTRFLINPVSIADLIVIASLIAAPFVGNLAFLRVLRSLRLIRSYHIARELRAGSVFFTANERVINAVINLVVFIFVVAAIVYVLQVNSNPQIDNYVDALYFTVATLTTTGFGDIVLPDTTGRLLAVTIMVVGVALFLRLIQAIFRPAKVDFRCPDCGLSQHDPDAVHCKHCGRTLNIETEGA